MNFSSFFRTLKSQFSFFLIFATVFCGSLVGANSSAKIVNFEPRKVFLLDQGPNVYLFRGNIPQLDDYFDYSDLTNRMREILAEKGMELSSDYLLIDLSLLNKWDNWSAVSTEKKWFSANPELGSFWQHPLYGCSTNPISLPSIMRYYMVKYYDFDGLKAFISELRNRIEKAAESDREVVIYMHCDEGKDLTGEGAACYLMQYKGFSYLEAIVHNFKIARRHVYPPQHNAIRWYAFYLRDVLGMTTIGPIEGE